MNKVIKIYNELKFLLPLITTRNNQTLVSIEELIKTETQVTTQHLTPEIKLRLITKKCRLYNANCDDPSSIPFKNLPFWGFFWPGGQSMSRFILDNPKVVEGKRILDFGSGCAASAIACKLKKCKFVLANDIDETAEVAAKINARLNNVEMNTSTKNLIGNSLSDFDVVIFGDVFYDEDFAIQLLPWIKKLVGNKQTCLIGDPGRHALSKELKLELLARYHLPEDSCLENHGFKFTNVFKVTGFYV